MYKVLQLELWLGGVWDKILKLCGINERGRSLHLAYSILEI